MPRFAANLTMPYNEHAFLDRFAAAADDGFEAVECLFPYAHAPAELAGRLRDRGLQQVLINAPPGDWDAGERGLACPRVHVMAGRVPDGLPPDRLQAACEANLAWAAAQAAGAGRAEARGERIRRGGRSGGRLLSRWSLVVQPASAPSQSRNTSARCSPNCGGARR